MRNSQDGTTAGQSSKYTSTRKHEANLQRNPMLHFQIGLILALLAAIFFIEMRMPEEALNVPTREEPEETVFTIDQVKVAPKEIIPVKKEEPKPKTEKPTILENPTSKEDTDLTSETPIDPTDPTDFNMIEPTDVHEVVIPDEPVNVPVDLIEQVPLFPGCEGLASNDERRDCMSSKISKFVNKKFRTERGEGLGLEGQNNIYVLFKIDTQGNVTEVQAKAEHPNLEKEAIRVTELLPKMTPGKQAGRNVNVTMALPIKFIIED